MYLEVKNLVKHYNSAYPIIRDLTFSVKKGELISFLGESGSGKTTFLKCLAGLEKINGGSISLNSNYLNNDNVFVKPQLRKIGFVFQDYPLITDYNTRRRWCIDQPRLKSVGAPAAISLVLYKYLEPVFLKLFA